MLWTTRVGEAIGNAGCGAACRSALWGDVSTRCVSGLKCGCDCLPLPWGLQFAGSCRFRASRGAYGLTGQQRTMGWGSGLQPASADSRQSFLLENVAAHPVGLAVWQGRDGSLQLVPVFTSLGGVRLYQAIDGECLIALGRCWWQAQVAGGRASQTPP